MSIELSPMLHMEVVVRDVDEAYEFLHQVFGAEKIEQEFASFLDSPFMKVLHVGLGQVVLQLCQPIVEQGSWYEMLRDRGPGVHNLTFLVDDIDEAVGMLAAEDITPLFSFPLDWAKLLGPGNTRPDVPPVYMMNSMERLGFHLELAERPWKQAPDPPFIYPAYTQPRPATREKVSPMLHIEIAVRDAEGACALLQRVFGAERVEKEFASFLDSDFMRVIHVLLGEVVLQLCQPLAEQGSWYDQIKTSGPGVHNITFVVENVHQVAGEMARLGVVPLFVFPLEWRRLFGDQNVDLNVPPVHMMNSREKLGFHLELGEKPAGMEIPFLYRPI